MATTQTINQTKVLLLTRLNGSYLVRLINIIRQMNCKVVLVATALGYNHSLNEKNYDDLGARIRDVYSSVVDPPPIITVSCVSQLLPFLQAIDPDLVITCQFPYELTKSFLAHRSIKINGHPSAIPLYRGSHCFARAILHQVSPWAVTWHYLEEGYDTGNILVQEFFDLQSPYGLFDIFSRSVELVFSTMEKAIEMSLSGHPGTPQRQPTADEEYCVDAKPLTIAERTITSGLTCREVCNLVEACRFAQPALLTVNERLYHVIEARRLETPLLPLIVGEVKRILNQYVQQCADGQMEYIVRIV